MIRVCVRGRLGRGLAAIVVAAALAAAGAGVAWAHASLVRSDPAPNTRFEQSPGSVTVWFDEPVEPDYAHLSVYDANSRRVDRLDSRYTPPARPGAQPSITATLPDLPAGSYVVVWRVISVDDGHAVGGAFAFGVRASPDPKAAVTAGAEADAQPDLTSHLIRFLDLIGQMLLFGAVVFRGLVWRPVLSMAQRSGELGDARRIRDEERRWLQLLADVLVGAMIIGQLGTLYVQARSTGVLFWQLFGTRWGAVWLVRAGLVFLACLWMESLLDGRRRAAWALSLALLITSALTSHSAATAGALGATADLLHEVSAAVWEGGLLLLALSLLALRGAPVEPRLRSQLGAEAVARFSGLAAVGVGVLLTTGLLLGWQQVQSWGGLLLTDYGRTLAVKLGLVLAALGLGAYNALGARAPVAAPSGRSPGWIVAESLIAGAVIFAAAVMTDLPPATAAGTAGAAVASEGQVPLALSTAAQGWRFDTQVTPGRIGSNVFEVAVTAPAGQTLEGTRVTLHILPPVGAAALELELAQTRSGLFSATGNALNAQGAWQMAVRLQPAGSGAAAVTASYNLDVGLDGLVRAAGTPLPWTVRAVAWLNQNGRAALAALLALGAGVWSWIVGRTRHGLARLGWMAAGLLLAVLLVTGVVLIG
jgi:copper transport protein